MGASTASSYTTECKGPGRAMLCIIQAFTRLRLVLPMGHMNDSRGLKMYIAKEECHVIYVNRNVHFTSAIFS